MTDLGMLPGCVDSEAVDINDHNQIVGTAIAKNGETRHAVLWTLRSG